VKEVAAVLDGIHESTAAELCRLGDLSWMLDEHQEKLIYKPYRAWEKRRHLDPGANRIFMIDAGRQVGKTFTTDLIRVEDCLRTPGGKFLLASAEAISLKEFVLPNLEAIISRLPDDIRPEFIGNRHGTRAAYYFHHNKAELKLVGIDNKPQRMRGPRLHGVGIHEAAFVTKLKHAVGSILYPQFQREGAATIILESSAPVDADHAFDTTFREPAIARKAYCFLTIDDNTALSERTKKEFVDAAREIDPDDAEREYYGKRVRNVGKTVFLEYDVQRHTRSGYAMPPQGLTMTWLDPGQRHFFAVVFSAHDAQRDIVVAQDCWAEKNPNSERVAAIVAAREYELWGTQPPAKMSRIPLEDIYTRSGKLKQVGWATLLKGDRTAHRAEKLYELAQANDDENEQPPSSYTWYNNDTDRWEFNPVLRVSDTSLQLINDLSSLYGLSVAPTTKDDLKAMTQLVRQNLNSSQFIVNTQYTDKLSRHMNACTWNDQRTKFEEHEQWGHFDLAAATVYGLRAWQNYRHILPFPPQHQKHSTTDYAGDLVAAQYEDDDDDDFY